MAFVALVAFIACTVLPCVGQQLAPEEWGAPPVKVTHSAGFRTIAGKKNTVTLNEKDLSFTVQAGPASWRMVPSSAKDMVVRAFDGEFNVRLADAGSIQIIEYKTGFKTGVKMTLD